MGIISTGDSKNADAIIRILTESPRPPTIAALFDGDKGGKSRLKKLEKLMKIQSIVHRALADDTTIEDHIIGISTHYLRATAKYVAKISGKDEIDLEKQFKLKFKDKFDGVSVAKIEGVGNWVREASKELGELEESPSPVGVAREYVALLEEATTEELKQDENLARSKELANWIASALHLPKRVLIQENIVSDLTATSS